MHRIEVRDPKLGDREQMRFECLRMAGGDLVKAREFVAFVEGHVNSAVMHGASMSLMKQVDYDIKSEMP